MKFTLASRAIAGLNTQALLALMLACMLAGGASANQAKAPTSAAKAAPAATEDKAPETDAATSTALKAALTAFQARNYGAASLQYTALAVKGNAEAQYKLGLINYYGLGTPSNVDKAAYWFDKAARQNHLLALSRLAQMYLSGLGEPEDIPLALKYIRTAADGGDSEAMLIIAECLDEGCGPYQADRDLSLKWLIRADAAPLQGVGFDNDTDVAFYHKDAKTFQGQRITDVKGMIKFRLGQYFAEQFNLDSQQKAAAYFEDAYNLGQKRAALYLAAIQSGREAKLANPAETRKLLELANDEESSWLLKVLDSTKTSSFDAAVKQLESRKTAAAYRDIIRLYSLGFGAYPDSKIIYGAQLNAARAGDADSMLMVATSPLTRNDERVSWIEKAASAGSGPAQYQLGIYYAQNGNMDKATGWLKKAVAQGYPNAEEVLKSLSKTSVSSSTGQPVAPFVPAGTQPKPAAKPATPAGSPASSPAKPATKPAKLSAASLFALPDASIPQPEIALPVTLDQAVLQAIQASRAEDKRPAAPAKKQTAATSVPATKYGSFRSLDKKTVTSTLTPANRPAARSIEATSTRNAATPVSR